MANDTDGRAIPSTDGSDRKPLRDVTVVDAGNLVAAPAATNLLADFGADVIRIEHPEYGDGLRELDPHKDGVPLWWKVTARNERSLTLDLSTAEGAAVFEDLVDDPRFVDNQVRVEYSDAVNGVVREWVGDHTREAVETALDEHGVAYSFVSDIEDVFADEHYCERGSLVRVPDDELGEAVVQNVTPKLPETPGAVESLGPRQGEHTEAVLRELGYDDDRVADLDAAGAI